MQTSIYMPLPEEVPVIFELVEQKPEMIGGTKAIYDFIVKNRLYPKTALTAGVGGWCRIGWIVDKRGMPRNIQILEESPQRLGFGEAGVKAISAMRFKPGMQRDRAVEVSMSQKIVFAVKQGEIIEYPRHHQAIKLSPPDRETLFFIRVISNAPKSLRVAPLPVIASETV